MASDKEVFLMFALPGERHEDSTPYAFITLTRFKEFVDTEFKKMSVCGEDYHEYYLTVMIPDKPIADEGDLVVVFDLHGDTKEFYIADLKLDLDNPEEYERVVGLIRQICTKILNLAIYHY